MGNRKQPFGYKMALGKIVIAVSFPLTKMSRWQIVGK